MIITMCLLVVATIITYFIWKNGREAESSNENGIVSAVICTVILAIIFGVTWGKSYNTYLEERSFYTSTKEQYYSAIDIYIDHAVIDMGKTVFTDLKYHGYQENISKFITSLRNRIIKYNKAIVSKRVMGNNSFFSWLIIKPDDDMVIIKMKSNL